MAGNWKMYKTPADTTQFFEKFRPLVANSEHCEIVICPPFTNLAAAVDASADAVDTVASEFALEDDPDFYLWLASVDASELAPEIP